MHEALSSAPSKKGEKTKQTTGREANEFLAPGVFIPGSKGKNTHLNLPFSGERPVAA
jgi:hypothetical protein